MEGTLRRIAPETFRGLRIPLASAIVRHMAGSSYSCCAISQRGSPSVSVRSLVRLGELKVRIIRRCKSSVSSPTMVSCSLARSGVPSRENMV